MAAQREQSSVLPGRTQGEPDVNESDKTHWKRLINPMYLGAYSLPPGEDMTVRIQSVGRSIVKGTDGKEEECTIATLQDQKPLILNRTNSKSIARLYGPYIEDWSGKDITLFATKTKVAKEVVECLRVRPQVAARQVVKSDIGADRWAKALESVKSGGYSANSIRAKFNLTIDQSAELFAIEGASRA
jgi:hypothetical protein